MAHAATLRKLAEGLVTSITGRSGNDAAFGRLTDRTYKNVRDQSHARTNQFAVKARLDGLVEKFAVLNRDDLATILETDLNELPKDSRWMPEILSLLLELSDRPVEKTSLEEFNREAEAKAAEEALTWDDIVGDEPYDDPDIWADVERGYHSSGDDEFYQDEDTDPTISTKATSLDDDPASVARLHLSQPDRTSIEHIVSARKLGESLKHQDEPQTLSELMIVRETLSMMNGLPNDLFNVDENGQVTASGHRISGASSSTLLDILATSCEVGTSINYLRQWVPMESHSYLQAMHGAIEKQISVLGTQLALIEQRYITPQHTLAVSLLDVQSEIESRTGPLVRLSSIVERSSRADVYEQPFALIDNLFDESAEAHFTDDTALFDVLVAVFIAGFITYLRPVGTWITRGCIVTQDQDVIFAEDSDKDCEPGKLWRLRFRIRSLPNGAAYTPRCIAAKARTLFALGKSRAFLNQLEGSHEATEDDGCSVVLLDFDNCLNELAQNSLAPFSQLFDSTLDSWISSISIDCSSTLRSKLLNDYDLKKTLTAFPKLFFSQDGILFQEFATTVVSRIYSRPGLAAWDDQFMLTELAQSTLGSSYGVDASDIYVGLAENDEKPVSKSLVRKVASLTVGHSLSWPVQNVIHTTTLDAHSKAFTFLLQIFCSGNLLQDRFYNFRFQQSVSQGALRLRQKVLWFSSTLFNYATTTAQALHKTMLTAMGRAADIDEMVAVFAGYEKRLETNLLLRANLEPVRDAVVGILELSEYAAKTEREARIMALHAEFDKNVRFLIAGIRGVGRAGGESLLERLAETLEWGVI